MTPPLPTPEAAPILFDQNSWIVIAVYLVFTTVMGHLLGRRQQTVRDFFLGGRSLPWPAVCGSIIATELSAMTLVGLPAILWAATGDIGYGILSIGAIVSRVLVAWWFLPRFYESELYSPYEYIGQKLGPGAHRLAGYLFMVGGILGQGTRVLLTAIVLQVVTGLDIYAAIWLVGVAALIWTVMGGIVTVIWTDVIQFLVFTFSAILTVVLIVMQYEAPNGDAGLIPLVSQALDAGKLHLLNLDFDFSNPYTLWAGAIGYTIHGLFAFGSDQMLVQRCLCCRSVGDARKALIWSSMGQVLTFLCLFVGVCLWAFYQHSGLTGVPWPVELLEIETNANRLLAVFIKYRVHWFFGGLMVAGIFAAAISSLDSILAALSQQTLSIIMPDAKDRGRKALATSRLLVVGWAIVLCAIASLFQAVVQGEGLLIELALSVVGYTGGAILGLLILALVPWMRRGARGLELPAALSVMTIVAITQNHHPDDAWATIGLAVATVWLLRRGAASILNRNRRVVLRLAPFILFIFACHLGFPRDLNVLGNEPFVHWTISFPWNIALGTVVMLLASLMVCNQKKPDWFIIHGADRAND